MHSVHISRVILVHDRCAAGVLSVLDRDVRGTHLCRSVPGTGRSAAGCEDQRRAIGVGTGLDEAFIAIDRSGDRFLDES